MSYDLLFSQYEGAEDLGLTEEGGAGSVIIEGEHAETAVVAEVAELTAVIEEQVSEIKELTETVDDLEETVEDLEEAVEGMESMLNSGNFNSISFANTYNRSLRLAAKLGCDYTGDRVGQESMSDAATANLMARTGIEAIGETLKNWGSKAVAFIKHIFNVIVNFFHSLFNKVEALAKREQQLRKRLNEGAKIKDKIKLGSWNAYIDYATDGMSTASKKDKGGYAKTDAAIAELVKVAGKVDGISTDEVKSKYSSLVSAIKEDAKGFGKYNEKKQGSKDIVVSQRAGIRTVITFAEPTINNFSEAASAIRSVRLSVIKAPEAKKMTSGETKSKADKSALTGVLDTCRALLSAVRESDTSKLMSNSTRDSVIGKLNNIKADNSDKSAEVNGKIGVVKATFALASQLSSMGYKNNINSIGAALDAVSAHLGFGKE